MPLLTRRLALAAPLLAMPALSRAAEVQRLRVNIIPINDVTPLFAAIEQGYFKEEGLEIDTTPSVGAAAGIPGLVAGSFDIVYGNVVSTLLAAQGNLPVRIMAPGTKILAYETDVASMVAKRDSGVKTGKDLEGKAVGVNTRNNVIWLYARAWIKKTGGNPDRVTYREVPHPQMEDALRGGQIDAGFMVVPYASVALAKPDYVEIARPYAEVQPGVDVGHYVATAKFLEENPRAIERFVRALRRGIDWYNERLNKPETIQLVSGFTKIDPAVLQGMRMRAAPSKVDPPQLEITMQLMIEHRLLRAPLAIAPLVAPVTL